MRIHFIQHEPLEGPAGILDWAVSKGASTGFTHIYRGDSFPDHDSFDWLVVMGGSMGAYEEDKFPWLKTEKTFLELTLKNHKTILGICLGAQILANVLGAQVKKNSFKEIGWFPVTLTQAGLDSPFFKGIPSTFQAFHWHGDTFDIPESGQCLASSEACPNQAFTAQNNRAIGLQFHLETTWTSAQDMIANDTASINEKAPYIQDTAAIFSKKQEFLALEGLLFKFLENLKQATAL